MNTTKRLSLSDFKVKKIESQNEIDKLIGGVAAACHPTASTHGCHDTDECGKDTGTV